MTKPSLRILNLPRLGGTEAMLSKLWANTTRLTIPLTMPENWDGRDDGESLLGEFMEDVGFERIGR